ncbi:MAG: arginine--tRNA ligase [Actinobacteria bacterium]|nr:arginine--tRNA ligase [Actinomycetota bacterium]
MLIDDLRRRLLKEIKQYLSGIVQKNGLFDANRAEAQLSGINLSAPKNKSFGDLSTNAAMVLASITKNNPMAVAEKLNTDIISKWKEVANISVIKPGFINFFISSEYVLKNLADIAYKNDNYGHNENGGGIKIQVEFVSANPTGNLHIGHGRWAALGDSLSNIFTANGYDVCREYYVNDYGSQIEKFSLCIAVIYLKSFGFNLHYPEDGYPEELVKDVVSRIIAESGDAYFKSRAGQADAGFKLMLEKSRKDNGADLEKITGQFADISSLGRRGVEIMIGRISETLHLMNIEFDNWFYESSLYSDKNFEKTVMELEKKNLIYKKDDALWFKASEYGDEKDRVVIRTGGQPTYFASDIMYLINKVKRGFDRLIYILGADHHGYIKRLHAIGRAAGLDEKNIEVIIGQLVRLVENGQTFKMSKRKGNVYMLEDLLEEVGSDAVRYFFSANSFDTHMDFDISLAKQKSSTNPVYYVQYAHARIANIINKVKEGFIEGKLDFNEGELNLPANWIELRKNKAALKDINDSAEGFENIFGSLILSNDFSNLKLSSNEETELAKTLILYPDALNDACVNQAPYMINQYLYRLAGQFHFFYKHHRIIDETILNTSRFKIVLLTRIVLACALKLLGVSAPEKM